MSLGIVFYFWNLNNSNEEINEYKIKTLEEKIEELEKEIDNLKQLKEDNNGVGYEVKEYVDNISKDDFLLNFKNDNLIIDRKVERFNYISSQLATMAKSCGINKSDQYYDELFNKFKDLEEIVYTFKYKGSGKNTRDYTIIVIPNKAEYVSFDAFKEDFSVCEAGLGRYPMDMNEDWLLFESSCGSGFDNNLGSINGCEKVKKIVKDNIEI
jgi:hypothetical protein